MVKYEISCKNCIHGRRTGRYIGCTEGKGTFPSTSRFVNCNKYKSRQQQAKELKKEKVDIQLAKMIKSGVN